MNSGTQIEIRNAIGSAKALLVDMVLLDWRTARRNFGGVDPRAQPFRTAA
jgi:hypothetical protein